MIRFAHTAFARSRDALRGPLMRGFGAFGGAELANRIVRVITTMVIARQLAPSIVGEAALALTLFELIRVLSGVGIGQRIIAAADEQLAAVCNTARRLFWVWSLVLVATQLVASAVLGLFFGAANAAAMLGVLAIVYVIMPAGLVQCYLAMREGRNAALARTAASQAIADHVLTAALLLAWPSPWSVILPKLLTAPIWLVMTRRCRPWQPDLSAGTACWRGMVRYGSGVLAAEGLTALRQQGDNLVIVATLGSSALGTYYFAYNAGLGIVTSLVGAFGTVSFPLLCKAQGTAERRSVMRGIAIGGIALFVPFVTAQALLAPFYVPILFGAHWAFAAPLIAILCVAGLAQLASVLTANWLRAEGRVGTDAGRSLFSLACALGGLYAGARTDSLTAAVSGLVAGTLFAAAASAFVTLAPALRKRNSLVIPKELLV
ncbi:MAG: oligosaccharide flippase family protein [Novosphingobium sp.]|nr:oligosaccharide flippase family protein [Novosphingobium sp.]